MRNLKKVLSLTLALVMMLGMMTFAGAAETTKITSKDLTDMKDVVNKEAVTLLVDLGVINGIKQADGTYKYAPKDTINRASYAKMAYAVMMASNNADVYKGVNTGLKDVAGHWAEGFIGYCVTTKLAVGNGNGAFMPDANITTVAAAKMLLVALGYDAKASGYEGDDLWSINIMRDAQKAGLLNNVDQKASENLTRDNAAQLIYNALFAHTVVATYQYDMGIKHLTKYEFNATTLGGENFSLVKVTGPVSGVNTDGTAKISSTTPAFDSASAVKSIDKLFAATPAMIGSTVTVYVKGTLNAAGDKVTASSIYSSVLTANASHVVATNYGYKGDTKASVYGKPVLTALLLTEKTKVASLETTAAYDTIEELNVYYNGVSKGTITSGADISRIGKYGVVTELKDTNDAAGVDTIVITDKKVATLSVAPVVSGGKVTIASLAIAKVDTAKVIGYEGLQKGDVVLYVTIGGTTYIEKAAMVEGVATGSHNNKGMLLGGTYYLTSELVGGANVWADDFTNTYNFFLDNGKNIVKAVKVTDEKAAGKYAVLSNIALVKTEGVDGTHYVEGKIVKTDGTVEKIKIASIDGVTVLLADGTAVVPDTNGSTTNTGLYIGNAGKVAAELATTAKVISTNFYYTKSATDPAVYTAKYFGATDSAALIAEANGMDAAGTGDKVTAAYAVKDQVYEYTINADGEYVLTTKLTKASYGALAATAKIFNGKAVFNTGNIGNSETVFLYESVDGNGKTVYTVYTGIANVPTTSENVGNGDGTQKNIVKNESGVATFVYAKVSGTTASSTDYVYIYDKDNFTTAKEGSTEYYIYDAIVNGVNGTVKLAGKPAAVGLYPVASVSDKGIKTLDTVITGAQVTTGVISVAGGSLITNTTKPTAFTYADAEIFYVDGSNVSTATAGEALALSAYDTVYVIQTGTDSGIAKLIYVIHQDPTLKTLTLAAVDAITVSDGVLADGSGTVTGYKVTDNDGVKLTEAEGQKMTTVDLKTMTINDVVYAKDAECVVVVGTYTVKVLVTDDCSGVQSVVTATFTVAAGS